MKVSNADPVVSSGPPVLVIFDCDGVLVDSERLNVQVESELISAEGWQLSPAEVARLFLGTSDEYMYREIERNIGRPLGEKWKRNLHESYARRFAESLQAVPGVTALLDWLDTRNIPTCVATTETERHPRVLNVKLRPSGVSLRGAARRLPRRRGCGF